MGKSDNSLIKSIYNHESDNFYNKTYQSKNTFSKYLISHLNLEKELEGHDGCVNCLEWNQSGTLLASGSDDLKLNIWNPFLNEKKKTLVNSIDTKHRGNIFSIKFLPFTNDSLVATAAADADINVYDINKSININEIHSHQNRVKRLATAQDEPFLFWSCGEDGLVLQHDIRTQSDKITSVILNFSKNKYNTSSNLECKCLAINQSRSEMIAVGCNDPYARVYDRRYIKHTQFVSSSTRVSQLPKTLFEYSIEKNDLTNTPFQYYVPGHLPHKIDEYRKRFKTLSVTHITFSPNGRELLLNLGGEQLYLFDILSDLTGKSSNREQLIREFNLFKYDSYRDLFKDQNNISDIPINSSNSNNNQQITAEEKKKNKLKLPPRAEELKSKANASFEEQNYVEAIEYYNLAIRVAPDSPILYGNRAAALMKRNWEGDSYAAMFDCYKALSIDSQHLKSHFRLAKCLHELKWYKEANDVIEVFVKRFPDYAQSQACENLVRDIKQALDQMNKKNEELKKQKSKLNKNNGEKRARKKPSSDLKDFLLDNEQEDESETVESENETDESENEQVYEINDINDYDLNDYLSEDLTIEETSGGELTTNGGLRRSTRKKRCDNNNNNKIQPGTSNLSNKKKKLNYILNCYNRIKSDCLFDFKSRYSGHCNVATDIKESAFLGENYVCAGSDDCSFFIWDKKTTNVVRILKGDESIVNCIQPHPTTPIMATSGIDPVVRIWRPIFGNDDQTNGENDQRVVNDIKSAVLNNQLQMNSHPFEFLFLNLAQNQQAWEQEENQQQQQPSVACRPS